MNSLSHDQEVGFLLQHCESNAQYRAIAEDFVLDSHFVTIGTVTSLMLHEIARHSAKFQYDVIVGFSFESDGAWKLSCYDRRLKRRVNYYFESMASCVLQAYKQIKEAIQEEAEEQQDSTVSNADLQTQINWLLEEVNRLLKMTDRLGKESIETKRQISKLQYAQMKSILASADEKEEPND